MGLWRSINRFASLFVFQGGSWQFPKTRIVFFDDALYLNNVIVGQDTMQAYQFIAMFESLGVAMHLFGSHCCKVTFEGITLVKLVVGSDDIFDSRTVFCFLQSQRIDNDGIVR